MQVVAVVDNERLRRVHKARRCRGKKKKDKDKEMRLEADIG